MIPSLQHVRDLSWSELLDIWKSKEEKVWQDYIQKLGLKDWEDYRFGPMGTFTRYGFDAFNLPEQCWKEYEMMDVHLVAPRLYTGPFRSWTKFNVDNPKASQPFIQLIQSPEIRTNQDVLFTKKALMDGSPSFGIGLYDPDSGIVSLFDGHHSFTALNLLIEEQFHPLPKLPLYLAEVPKENRAFFSDLIEGCSHPVPMYPQAR